MGNVILTLAGCLLEFGLWLLSTWTSIWLHPTRPLDLFMTLHKSPSHARALTQFNLVHLIKIPK
jgi:hypothetical protein